MIREGRFRMKKMNGGQIVAECFEKLKIEYYFGYNGHGIWNILNALIDKPHIKEYRPTRSLSCPHGRWIFQSETQSGPCVGKRWAWSSESCITRWKRNFRFFRDFTDSNAPTHYLDKSSLEEVSVHCGDDMLNIFRPITKRVWYAIRPDLLVIKSFRLTNWQDLGGRAQRLFISL
jgi:hypothetical protein